MRPVLQKNKLSYKLWIVYAIILLICIVGIALALSNTQYFKEENVGRALGIVNQDSEKEDEYNELKSDFNTIFTNQVDNLQTENINIKKINTDYDIIVTAFNREKEEENCSINASIPYINIDDSLIRQFNKHLNQGYKEKAERLMNQISSMNIIYSVEYKAYIQNNILSLVIRSEYKEGDKSQKVELETFNYNLAEKREITIDEILILKNITQEYATNKIRNEIKKIQEQNQPLINEGYPFYERDYNADRYDISNSKYFLYGKDGMLYVIYPYGNEDDTSEMDIVIFQ